jgi:hypothetical protein
MDHQIKNRIGYLSPFSLNFDIETAAYEVKINAHKISLAPIPANENMRSWLAIVKSLESSWYCEHSPRYVCLGEIRLCAPLGTQMSDAAVRPD